MENELRRTMPARAPENSKAEKVQVGMNPAARELQLQAMKRRKRGIPPARIVYRVPPVRWLRQVVRARPLIASE